MEDKASVNATLQEKTEEMKEWTRGIVYDDKGRILATTCDVDLNEIEDLLTAFDDHDDAFRYGLQINGDHYDVHRFFDTLIYGRRGDSKTGEGICICKTTKNSAKGKKEAKEEKSKEEKEPCIYALITYGFPTLSARAIPQLQEFCEKHVLPLL